MSNDRPVSEIVPDLIRRFLASSSPTSHPLHTVARELDVLPVCEYDRVYGLNGKGQVVSFKAVPPYDLRIETSVFGRHVTLGYAVWHHPELDGLRPARPQAAQECAPCFGKGRFATSPNDPCPFCGGLAWWPPADWMKGDAA